jgi:hypothetical protein
VISVSRRSIPLESGTRAGPGALAIAVLGAVIALAAFPALASAHGPVAPVASSYLARVQQVPAGLDAKAVDGDLRMWLSVPGPETVVVLDYRGAPYLRFSSGGVEVNQNSSMYYLNQTPAQTPPTTLGPRTPANWHQVTGGHSYLWHDGRLHALASVAIAPGTTYVGRWRVPLVIDGRQSAISGGLWHAPNPSIVWFWPIAVLLTCVLAARRLARPGLDFNLARALAVVALLAIVAGGLGIELHGRPAISTFQLIMLALILCFVGWASARLARRRPGYFFFFVVAFASLWMGAELVPTLTHGFVLMTVPALVARVAAVISLGCGAALLLYVFRMADLPDPRLRRRRRQPDQPQQRAAEPAIASRP